MDYLSFVFYLLIHIVSLSNCLFQMIAFCWWKRTSGVSFLTIILAFNSYFVRFIVDLTVFEIVIKRCYNLLEFNCFFHLMFEIYNLNMLIMYLFQTVLFFCYYRKKYCKHYVLLAGLSFIMAIAMIISWSVGVNMSVFTIFTKILILIQGIPQLIYTCYYFKLGNLSTISCLCAVIENLLKTIYFYYFHTKYNLWIFYLTSFFIHIPIFYVIFYKLIDKEIEMRRSRILLYPEN